MSAQPTVSPTDQPTPDEPEQADVFEEAPADQRDVISRKSTAALVVSGLLVALLCGAGAIFLDRTLNQAPTSATGDAPASDGSAADATLSEERTAGDGHLIGDGLWVVGDDIDYGTFAATVPADSPGCTWERADSDDGSSASVIDSGIARPGENLVVTIKKTDRVFRTNGCGTWRAIAS
ncbi:hypothetical protein [Luedemannella helvata]|uniref:hypothetical protein n=1 Tax=Luedemannella helvata TaxID=349315 RepID=UPI0031D20AC6